MVSLRTLEEALTQVLHEQLGPLGTAGAVVGVAQGDEQLTVAHGVANLNTGQAFTPDTGFLLGSVTKIMTTTVLLRLVERGLVDLDAPATQYIPELTLRDPDAARRITVRMLVNHTNGIDADTLVPTAVRGREASRYYTEHLSRVGVLFEPGTCIHYTNPGFVLAARVIEEMTGRPWEEAIAEELFEPCGMGDATAVQTQAFLRRTAVGAFAEGEGDARTLRATSLFTYPESIAGAGGTPIVTVADMLAFGRMHLAGGVAPDGTRVLSSELVAAMQTPTFDLGIPQAPPMGLAWWLFPMAGTTIPWHGGASPGGNSSFCILPGHDAVVVSFVAGLPGAPLLNDLLQTTAIEHLTGTAPEAPFAIAPTAPDPGLAGEYASFQTRMVVEVDGDGLGVANHFLPFDDDHRRVMEGTRGSAPPVQRSAYRGIGRGQFHRVKPRAADPVGFSGRIDLLTALPPADGRPAGLHSHFRFTPKAG